MHYRMACAVKCRQAGLIALAGILGSFSGLAQSQDLGETLSAESLIVVQVDEGSKVFDRVLDPRLQVLVRTVPQIEEALDGKSFRDFRNVTDLIGGRMGTSGTKLLRSLLGGSITLAIEPPVESGQDPAVTLIVQPEDVPLLEKTNDALLDLIRADAQTKGNADPVETGTYRGQTGYQLEGDLVYTILDGHLVLCNSSDAMKRLIDRRLDGISNPLSSTATYQQVFQDPANPALAHAWINLEGLRTIDPEAYSRPEEANVLAVLMANNWLETYFQTSHVAGDLIWDDTRLALQLEMPTVIDRDDQVNGLYLPPTGQGARPIRGVPGTMAQLALWRDLGAIWDIRDQIFSPEQLQQFAQLDTAAGQFLGGRDFGTGVLGALDTDWSLLVAERNFTDDAVIPDVQLPAFALVIERNPEDPEFKLRLQAAFQTFIGLANIGIAQQGGQPLILNREEYNGIAISTAKYESYGTGDEDAEASVEPEPVSIQYNFEPSLAITETHVILASTLPLVENLLDALNEAGPAEESTLLLEADGAAIAQQFRVNRQRLVMQNMLEEGNDRRDAEGQVDLFISLIEYLGAGTFQVIDGADHLQISLSFDLDPDSVAAK